MSRTICVLNKKIVCVFLGLALVFQPLLQPAFGFSTPYSDLQNHWAATSIEAWIAKGFASGYPDATFKPEKSVTRVEFMAFLDQAFEWQRVTKADYRFKDLPMTHWGYEVLQKAVGLGVINGYPDGTIRPDQTISRQEAAVVLATLRKLPNASDRALQLKDAATLSDWSLGAVGAVLTQGYMGGYPDGSFKPTAPIRRAEAVVAMTKVYEAVAFEKPVTYDQAGSYGPESGGEAKGGDVIVSADGVILNRLEIRGNLILAEGIGEGDIVLNDIIVQGQTLIRGGGKNSIHINGGNYQQIVIEKVASDELRLVVKNNTGLDVRVDPAAASEKVILEGSFKVVEVNAPGVSIRVKGDSDIGRLQLSDQAGGGKMLLDTASKIENLVLESKTEVLGQGRIVKAEVKANEVVFEKAPESQVVLAGLTTGPTVKVAQPTVIMPPSNPVSFPMFFPTVPSDSGPSTPPVQEPVVTTINVSGISLAPTQMALLVGATGQLTAAVTPGNASNTGVQWQTSNPGIATVSGGLVTAVSPGIVTITASAAGDPSKTATAQVTVTAPIVLSTQKDFLTFSLPENAKAATVDTNAGTLAAEVIYGTPLTALIPTFTVSPGATVTVADVPQVSGVTAQDFSAPVLYKVQAEDGTVKEWVVTVTVEGPVPRQVTAIPGAQSVKISWQAVSAANTYTIHQSETLAGPYVQVAADVVPTHYTVTGLTPGKRYYFKVNSVENAVAGTLSTAVTAIANIDELGPLYLGNRLLISNESLSTAATQSTGALSMASVGVAGSALELEAYRMDPFLDEAAIAAQAEAMPQSMMRLSQTALIQASVLNDEKSFYVYNFVLDQFVTVVARLAYVGTHSEVWVEAGGTAPTVTLTNAHAQSIGVEFDNNIHQKVVSNFHTPSDINEDGRVAILCFDIQDGFGGPNTGYIGGYFRGGDLESAYRANNMEIFYMDTYPAMGLTPATPQVNKVYSTLAHEYQHMVNYNRNRLLEQTEDMDVWLDEALSMAAEQIYLNSALTSRINYYNVSDAIRDGRSLLDWNDSEVLANYSLSYLFGQYLRIQLDKALGPDHGVKYYKEIIEDTEGGYKAVEKVLQKYIDPTLTFGQFMTNFRVAMMLKAPEGPYGFGGEAGFNSLVPRVFTGTSSALKGGGAVIVPLEAEGFTPAGDAGAAIKMVGVVVE